MILKVFFYLILKPEFKLHLNFKPSQLYSLNNVTLKATESPSPTLPPVRTYMYVMTPNLKSFSSPHSCLHEWTFFILGESLSKGLISKGSDLCFTLACSEIFFSRLVIAQASPKWRSLKRQGTPQVVGHSAGFISLPPLRVPEKHVEKHVVCSVKCLGIFSWRHSFPCLWLLLSSSYPFLSWTHYQACCLHYSRFIRSFETRCSSSNFVPFQGCFQAWVLHTHCEFQNQAFSFFLKCLLRVLLVLYWICRSVWGE